MFNLTGLTNQGISLIEANSATFPLFLFIVGIFIYSLFIFRFYKFLAKRDVFELNLQDHSKSFLGFLGTLLNGIFYIIEYILILPFFAFFWFAVLALVLAMLSKSNVESILLVAMALVGSVRMTAYYNEELSKDLAKMLPFALLGIFLVDVSFFSFQSSLETLKQFPLHWKQMLYYLGFILVLETLLRIVYAITSIFKKEKQEEKK